ncbi:MAG: hypothetical protein HYT90_03475 [Candidatus Omnitrophica bacterium]|nr:hypothetical protein [Candidatus Omnitrophota bacterium]
MTTEAQGTARLMPWAALAAAGLLAMAGCARKSSLLLERQAVGPIAEEPLVAMRAAWRLEPVMQTEEEQGVEVNVNHASQEYLTNFFGNRSLFGSFAGPSPYYPEHLVFYVQIANRSNKKIYINPGEFTVVDDRGNQYATIGVDYVTAFAESRKPVSSATRGVIEEARPGYFGFSLPVGRMFAPKSQAEFARLKQASLQSGYLYPGVIHDGLIAFWNPAEPATRVRLLITNVKTDFDAKDEPRTALEFAFDFTAARQ